MFLYWNKNFSSITHRFEASINTTTNVVTGLSLKKEHKTYFDDENKSRNQNRIASKIYIS